MQRRTLMPLALITLAALPVLAHHPAADIVDEEIYAQIDAMVSETPHGDMVFDDMGGTTRIDITGRVSDIESLIADQFLDYVALLDGDVSLSIEFTSRRDVTLTVVQVEDGMDADKAAARQESETFSGIKAVYRR